MRALVALVLVVLLGVGGFFGWRAWQDGQRAAAYTEVRTLVAEGHLKDAKAKAENLRAEHPDDLEAYVVSALALRALHDRPGGQEVLDAGYALAPAGFPLLSELVDHRLRGPDDPRKGWNLLTFLDEHLAAHPEDANLVAEGRLVALAKLEGVYVPSLYETSVDEATGFEIVSAPKHHDLPLHLGDAALERARQALARFLRLGAAALQREERKLTIDPVAQRAVRHDVEARLEPLHHRHHVVEVRALLLLSRAPLGPLRRPPGNTGGTNGERSVSRLHARRLTSPHTNRYVLTKSKCPVMFQIGRAHV